MLDAGGEVGMAQFKYKPRSNIRKVFPNHVMSLWSETRKSRQSKVSVSTSLTETRSAQLKNMILLSLYGSQWIC